MVIVRSLDEARIENVPARLLDRYDDIRRVGIIGNREGRPGIDLLDIDGGREIVVTSDNIELDMDRRVPGSQEAPPRPNVITITMKMQVLPIADLMATSRTENNSSII